MTNSSLKSAANILVAALLATTIGCSNDDGTQALADARAAIARNDLVKGDRLLKKALKRNAANVDALVEQAILKLRIGDLETAKQAVAAATQLDPETVDIKLLDAHLAYHAKDYARAAGIFKAIAEDVSLDKPTRAAAFAGLGAVEMTRNAAFEARLALLKAIRLDRRNAAARYHLALLYRDSFNYLEAARDQFEIYTHLDPVACTRVQKVQRGAILEIKENIIRRDSERPGANARNRGTSAKYLAEADAAAQNGRSKVARGLYTKALQADPLNAQAAKGLAKMYLLSDNTSAGRLKAFEAYRTATALTPTALRTALEAGALGLQVGQYATSAEIYSQALAADPSSVPALDGLIIALRKTGANAKMIAAYADYRKFLTDKTK